MPGRRKKTQRKARPRRSGEQTRRLVLEAAAHRLADGGPEAIRLQNIAADVGISHPAILHHFGSREGLTQALANTALDGLRDDVLEALATPVDAPGEAELVRRLFAAWGDSGHARLFAWRALMLDEPRPEHSEQEMLRVLIDALQADRVERARSRGIEPPSREDSAFLVRLIGLALMGDAIAGSIFNLRAALDGQTDPQERFRAWLAERLTDLIRPSEGA